MRLLLVAGVWEFGEECVEFQGALHGAIDIDVDVSMGISSVVGYELVTGALGQRISIRAPCLQLVADAPIEILSVGGLAPKREVARGKDVVDQFRDRPVKFLHHRAQVDTAIQITDGVVVIAQERRHPGNESIFLGVMFESIPEDLARFVAEKCVDSIAGARSDEVNLVVSVPVFETVLPVEVFVRIGITLTKIVEASHESDIIENNPILRDFSRRILNSPYFSGSAALAALRISA